MRAIYLTTKEFQGRMFLEEDIGKTRLLVKRRREVDGRVRGYKKGIW